MRGLIYVTRVAVPSTSAQSRQIEAMRDAFGYVLGDRFRLFCSVPGASGKRRHRFDGKTARNIRFALLAAAVVLRDRNTVIFTRDIGVAALTVLVRGHAVYEAHREPVGKAAAFLMRWLSRRKQFRLVAISAALAAYYKTTWGFPDDRVLVAHDGAFPERYGACPESVRQRLRAELGLPEDKILLVHTGSLYKGGSEMFGDFLQAFGGRAFLIHVGGSEKEIAQLREAYSRHAQDQFLFMPHQPPNVARNFQIAADFLIYLNTRSSPIYWCTSPLKLFEYMASGVPIFAANIGSVREIVNERNAFCFTPGDRESIRAAVAFALEHADEAAARAAAARREIENTYSWYRRAANIAAFAAGMVE